MRKTFAALLVAACFVAFGVVAVAQEGGHDPAEPESSRDSEQTVREHGGDGTGTTAAQMAETVEAGHGEKPAAISGDPEAGRSKAAPCAACHGPDGNSPAPEWPKLAGQHAGYLFEQLRQYKSGERSNPVMQGMAASLSEQDMRDISAFYSNQTVKPGVADESLVDLGEKVYRGGNAETGVPACIACHGPTGAGIPGAGYPAIGGQHARYVLSQLELYASGQRRGGDQIMTRVADRLGPREMEAVSSYVQGLHLREGAFHASE